MLNVQEAICTSSPPNDILGLLQHWGGAVKHIAGTEDAEPDSTRMENH